ncbi:MAG: GntR family transcriptional regulator [Ardenticatenaceae bacterium]
MIPLPKYYQIAEGLREQITSGRLKPNDQIPTEEALCRQYQVSRGTVQQAIRELVRDGLIRRERGRGSFVNQLPKPQSTFFTLTSFAQDMRRQGRVPTTQLLTAEQIPAPRDVAERLGVAVGESLLHIVRLRLADGQPVAYETRYLASALCPTLLEHDLEEESIHWLLVSHYQIPLVRMTHTVEIQALSAPQAEMLQVQAGTRAFFVDRLTYTTEQEQKVPAVWFQAIYRQDNYDLQAQFLT